MKPATLIFTIFLLIPIRGGFTLPVAADDYVPDYVEQPDYFVLETLTIYHPVTGQCDDSPLITASNARIDIDKLRRQEIRWMALSRDLLKRWNGAFSYGDTVIVKAGDPDIDGLWVINDSMNKRFKDRGDLLFHSDSRKGGMWNNVKVAKWGPRSVASI